MTAGSIMFPKEGAKHTGTSKKEYFSVQTEKGTGEI